MAELNTGTVAPQGRGVLRCDACGGRMFCICGRHPVMGNRIVCPTCMAETLDNMVACVTTMVRTDRKQ